MLPQRASRHGTVAACERSLKRLGLDAIDLYLLHWPGSFALADTIAAFRALRERGAIMPVGRQQLRPRGDARLIALPGGVACAANQVCYSLGARGIDFDLLPWQRERALPLMAYCPIDQGALAAEPRLAALAQPLGLTAARLALAWALRAAV